jgi:tRNA threonylcarbamoyl adenosine modification protein YeaZ
MTQPASSPFASRRLVIDSATENCSVALFEGDRLLAGESRMLGRGHAEALVPMIAALPDRGRAASIVVDSGPGSFTGIRVGLAAARALGLAWNAPVAGYESLSLVAAMALAASPQAGVDVVMTGGHGEWFFRPFDAQGLPLAPLASLPPEAVIARLSAPLVAGSQAEACFQAARASRPDLLALALWPDARSALLLAPGLLFDGAAPAYGRAPDARLPTSSSTAPQAA